MNLTRLTYFLEAAKFENFSQAAQKLYTSQPNLSKQISLLEQEVGFRLFHRVSKTVYLTSAGRHLYEKLKGFPQTLRTTIEEAKAIDREESGTICIGILEGQKLGHRFFDHLQVYFQENYKYTCHMERGSFKDLRRGLEACQYDIIITLAFELKAIKGVAYNTIKRQQGAIAISRGNPLSGKKDLNISDLKDQDFVAISGAESPTGYTNLLEKCESAGFTPKIVRESTSLESLLLYVEAGIGVSLLDRNTRLEQNDNIVFVPVDDDGESSIVAAWLSERSTPAIEALTRIMAQGSD